jgi:hypothetical protein
LRIGSSNVPFTSTSRSDPSRGEAVIIRFRVCAFSCGLSVIHRKTAVGSGGVETSSVPKMMCSMTAVAMTVLPAPVVAVRPTACRRPFRAYEACASSRTSGRTAVQEAIAEVERLLADRQLGSRDGVRPRMLDVI